jgi:hypothetical protein
MFIPAVLTDQPLARPQLARRRSHDEEGKLRRRFGQHIRRIRERNPVSVCISAVNVVEPDSKLRHHL